MAASMKRGRRWDLLARSGLAGGIGVVVVLAMALAFGESTKSAVELSFSLSALPFSVGLLGWSLVLMGGDGVERFANELGLSSEWSVRGARQAMSILIATGGGGMLVAGLIGGVLGA